MHRSSRSAYLEHEALVNGSQAETQPLTDQGYAAPLPKARRARNGSLSGGATQSSWLPPVVPWCMIPNWKPHPHDKVSSLFVESDLTSGEYSTVHDARSLAWADGDFDSFQSHVASMSPGAMRSGNSQVSFCRGNTQEALRLEFLIESYTPNENVSSRAEVPLEGQHLFCHLQKFSNTMQTLHPLGTTNMCMNLRFQKPPTCRS